jgi:hypothetical protein
MPYSRWWCALSEAILSHLTIWLSFIDRFFCVAANHLSTMAGYCIPLDARSSDCIVASMAFCKLSYSARWRGGHSCRLFICSAISPWADVGFVGGNCWADRQGDNKSKRQRIQYKVFFSLRPFFSIDTVGIVSFVPAVSVNGHSFYLVFDFLF